MVVFSQAPSGRAPLSPSLNSRPSPISASPAPLGPEPPSLRSHSPVRSGAAGVVLGAVEEAPCVNGRWGTLRPRPSQRSGAREGSPSSSSSSPQQPSPSQGPDSPPMPPLLNGSSPSPHTSPAQAASPPSRPHAHSHPHAPADYGWDLPPPSSLSSAPEALSTNGLHTPPPTASPHTPPGAVSPAALRRSLEAVKALSSSSSTPPSSSSSSSAAAAGGGALASPPPSSSPPQAPPTDGHSIPPIARRQLGHHPPQSLNVGKPLYQSLNCKPMQMYVLDVSRAKSVGVVSWRVYGSGGAPAAVTGPPETSLHTVVQGRGELIIFGGLMDKKQNVKYYPKTNALYFVRAKR